jgi:hypothetical protein
MAAQVFAVITILVALVVCWDLLLRACRRSYQNDLPVDN